jgi:uncharacterized protein (TIGR02453 family)
MKTVLEFLKGLKENNTREWFEENRKGYESAKTEFEKMLNGLIPEIYSFDPEIGPLTAKDCVFRIYRDVRFSKDKSPYKTNMGGFICKGGRKGLYAGYYVHIEPGNPMLAGGIYMPPPEVLKKARQEIYFNAEEFKGILNGKDFKKTFKVMEDDKLSRPPKDFPADFKDIELLKYKSYTVFHLMKDETVLGKDLQDYMVKVFKVMQPFNGFINRGLVG